MKVGIIGSAGRGDTIHLWNREIYFAAYRWLLAFLKEEGKEHSFHSGGAAWADHLLVSLVLSKEIRPEQATLHLPAQFVNGQYMDTGRRDFIMNPGGTMNYYHRAFSLKMGGSTTSLDGIAKAIKMGVQIKDYSSDLRMDKFKARNLGIGDVDTLIAFTWSEIGDASGGTGHCWKFSRAERKIHVSLKSFQHTA